MTIFEGTGCQTTKIYNRLCRKGVPNTVFKFFVRKTSYHLNLTRKTGFGGTFFPISVILLGRSDSPVGGPASTIYDFHENWYKTASSIVHSYTAYIRAYIITMHISIADLYSKSSKMENVTTHTSPTHPIPKSLVSEYLLFCFEISLKKHNVVFQISRR